MNRTSLPMLMILLTISLLTGCVTEMVVKENPDENSQVLEVAEAIIVELEQQNQELEVTITELKQKSEELESELAIQLANFEQIFSSHEEQVDKILAYLNEGELTALSKDGWQYTLSVNEIDVPESGVLEIEDDQVEIILAQHQLGMYLLPDEILEQGAISGDSYQEHILQVTPEQDEETWRDGTVVTGYGLIYADLNSGDEIEITITDELMNRLGLETSQIIIRKK